MIILLLIITLATILVLFFYILKSKNIDTFITALCSLALIIIILSPKKCIEGTIIGIKLFIGSVFPSIFLFLIIVNVLIAYDGVYIYSKIFGRFICRPLKLPYECSIVIIISMLCGYPLGAKYSSELYAKKIIDIDDYKKIVCIASNPSPIFVIGTVGTSMLNNNIYGYLLLISCYISCFVMGIFSKTKKSRKYISTTHNYNKASRNLSSILKNSIFDAFKTSLGIGGFVIMFSSILYVIKSSRIYNSFLEAFNFSQGSKDILNGFLSGIIEMTNGCYNLSKANLYNALKLPLIAFLLSFGGFCIMMQAYSFISGTIHFMNYFKSKIIQGAVCLTICLILFKMFSLKNSVSVFNSFEASYSITGIIIILSIIFIPFIVYKFSKLFHIS